MSTQREGTHHARRQLELDLILSTPPTRRKGAPHARRQLELNLSADRAGWSGHYRGPS